MGTGSTGVVANKFYCHFIGNDQEPECLDVVNERLMKLGL